MASSFVRDGVADIEEDNGQIAVPVASLRVGTVLAFDLYLPTASGQHRVLFRERNYDFTEEALERIKESGVKQLYIEATDHDGYLRYVEQNLDAILADPTISIEKKSSLLYGSIQNLMREVMADARSSAAIERSKDVVNSTVDFMAKEERAFSQLLKVVSYDYYTYTHSVNVMVFGVSLAKRVGVDEPELLRSWGEGMLLHDVGKSEIDPAIVNCKGKLSEEQWLVMKQHPVFGADILSEQEGLAPEALDIVRHHHEKLSGVGYPDQLHGDAISIPSRICTIADIFDALTTRRSYKAAVESFEALKLMRDEMASELDEALFRAFVGMMGNPEG